METVIKENAGYRLLLKKNPCFLPDGLNNIEFIGEQLKDGEVTQTSTYQFFMTQDELNTLAKALTV
jgi:hypothetical protein